MKGMMKESFRNLVTFKVSKIFSFLKIKNTPKSSTFNLFLTSSKHSEPQTTFPEYTDYTASDTKSWWTQNITISALVATYVSTKYSHNTSNVMKPGATSSE